MRKGGEFGYVRLADVLWIWSESQGLTVAAVHVQIADWLELHWRLGSRKMVLNAFRGAGKSTLAAIFAAWILGREPDSRILVLAAEEALARKTLDQIEKIIRSHPLFAHLVSSDVGSRGRNRITVRRRRSWRDPSVLAAGLGGNITGARADLIVADDVEVPKTAATRDLRSRLREKLSELEYVLTPTGGQLFIGTPHGTESLYSGLRHPGLDEKPFLSDAVRLSIPLLTPDGNSVWPERFSNERIKALRERQGPAKFSGQMLLKTDVAGSARLDPGRLIIYDRELEYSEIRGRPRLFLGDELLVGAAAAWDPAFGKGSASVAACVFCDAAGRNYIHDVDYLKTDYAEHEDAATAQCERVIEFLKRNRLSSIIVEDNGLGRFLPRSLRHLLRRRRMAGVAVIAKSVRVPKHIRILTAFDALLAARRLYVRRPITESRFMTEFGNWRESGRGNDDGLDAVAHCLLSHPVRFGDA